jgi:hypothetical protein
MPHLNSLLAKGLSIKVISTPEGEAIVTDGNVHSIMRKSFSL